MAENPEESDFEIQTEVDGDVTPLRVLAIEAHEIYLELKNAGFPDVILAQIMSNLLYDALATTTANIDVDIEIDDEYDDKDDDPDERNA